MIRVFKLTFILIIFSNCLYSQDDSIRSQILNYEDSKSIIISKGRGLLLDKFIEGDLAKVKEIKDYLIKIEDDYFIAFYPREYWFVLYWTKDYSELAENLLNYAPAKVDNYCIRIRQPYNKLFDRLKEMTLKNKTLIKGQIQDSDLDSETKQILDLNLECILLDLKNIYAQDSLNEQADNFLKTYPQSKFEDFTKKHIRYKLIPENWGIAYELFSGYGIYTGNLSDNYTNNVPLGVSLDICYKKFELYLRANTRYNKTKKDFSYSLGTWEKGSKTTGYLLEASLGYATYNSNRFKLSPFAGIGTMNISPTTKDIEKTPELKEVSLNFTTTYIAGINFDIKFGPKHTPKYSPKTSYWFMRIRYGYTIPRFEKKYHGMSGNMHYITIGLGNMERNVKREY
ncbi:MAG: hypothetical protein ACOX0M_09355 [Salinivirgaceae bacterium]|jgi:hypothetical protein|nr:hypothetical protein [Bacteroidales bacterium]